ncbi:BON domain-containing protein [Aquabacterium sp.]|uniref:BON domain-containing protein n=1 Tax=Aquabacterium sp. TaxID=1872578 RepID=UPI00378335F7
MNARMTHRMAPLLGALIAALSMAACSRSDDGHTVGQKMDSVIADAQQKAAETKTEVKQELTDAAITASVNAELAKDPTLSAMRINVDTSHGEVSLRGTAPDNAAREHATQLAAAVKGVNHVDNQLVVNQ